MATESCLAHRLPAFTMLPSLRPWAEASHTRPSRVFQFFEVFPDCPQANTVVGLPPGRIAGGAGSDSTLPSRREADARVPRRGLVETRAGKLRRPGSHLVSRSKNQEASPSNKRNGFFMVCFLLANCVLPDISQSEAVPSRERINPSCLKWAYHGVSSRFLSQRTGDCKFPGVFSSVPPTNLPRDYRCR